MSLLIFRILLQDQVYTVKDGAMLAKTLCLFNVHFTVLLSALAVTKTYFRGRVISDYVIGLNSINQLRFQVDLLNSSVYTPQLFLNLFTLIHC